MKFHHHIGPTGERNRRARIGGQALAAVAGVAFAAVAVSAPAAAGDPNEWPMYSRTYDNTRYSPLADINDGNGTRRWPGPCRLP